MYLYGDYFQSAAASPGVVVYSLEGCPSCVDAKAYLKSRGVPFEVRDGAGMGPVPIIEIAGRRIVGFDRSALDAALVMR